MTPTLPEALARVERLRRTARMILDGDWVADQSTADDINYALDHLEELLADLQRLRGALPTLPELREIEWSYSAGGRQCCPACVDVGRHADDCWIARLAALLETPDGR